MIARSKKSIIFQQIFVLSVCAIFDLFAGSMLEEMRRNIEILPGLVVMIPPLIDLRGNIGCALGSRLGTALHLGTIKPRFFLSREMKINVISAIIVSVLGSLAVGTMSFIFTFLAGVEAMSVFNFLFIALFSGVLSGIILTPIAVLVSILSFKRGWDPDNITGPVMTTIGDIVAIFCIFLSVSLLGWLRW
ncbi:MAG: magnesium transporter [Candidatus Hadarchaeales archaeon]